MVSLRICDNVLTSQFKTSENSFSLALVRMGILDLNILIRLIQMHFAVFVCVVSDSSAVWWICVAEPVCVFCTQQMCTSSGFNC